MKKTTLLLLCFFFTLSNLFAINRDSTEAHQIALEFFNKTNKTSSIKKAPAAPNSVQLIFSKAKENESSSNYYYVFNHTGNNGFVIVSGNENTNDILGYSDENSFDPLTIPDNMQYWLSFYEGEMDHMKEVEISKDYTQDPSSNKIKNASENVLISVAPLLGGIKWNQASPYNNLCPMIPPANTNRSVTGCVATGMAQVMKYHKWPITGTGSNSYTTYTHDIPLSVDFSQTTFDWSNMTDTYNSNSSSTEMNAIATLMYNCGVAVSMDYAESSGAVSKTAARKLIDNFGYDENIQFVDRDFYTRNEWIAMLKEELSAARPVLYSGRTSTAGHLFVCDGYDNNDFFHLNWGWGGTSNGYFRISALDPDDQGIGGSTGGYNQGQSIITGIQKPTASSVPKYLIFAGDTLSYPSPSLARNASFTINVTDIFNYGINSFAGKIGLALFDSNNTYVSDINQFSVSGLGPNYGWNLLDFTNITIANVVTNGNYKIYCVYKSNTTSNWEIVRTEVGTPNYINLVVNSSSISFNTPTDEGPALQLNSLTQTGNLYKDRAGRINVSITNNGKEYNSLIGVKLQSTTDNNVYQIVNTESINIAAGETRELNFNESITLNAGTYYLSVLHTPKNTGNTNDLVQLGSATTVTVLTTPTGNPVFSLLSAISFPDANNVNKNKAILTAQITNTGSLYDKKMIAFVFPKAGGGSLTYFGYQNVIIDQNETKEVVFQGAIDLSVGDYLLAIRYQNNSNDWTAFTPTNFSSLDFTLIDISTDIISINPINNLVVYPNPATDQITIQSNNSIRAYRIFNLVGEELQSENSITNNQHSINVSPLYSGTYLIRIETELGISNHKFIKQ